MKQREIQERNKQIALMLGWKEATLEYKLRWCAVPTEERLNRLDQDHVPILMKENKDPLWSSSLLWHSDWNWLMEAVEFIEKLQSDNFIMDFFWLNGSNVALHQKDKQRGLILWETHGRFKNVETKKEAVFIIVSDFAKLYNEKKL
jgi:hypothetical protein